MIYRSDSDSEFNSELQMLNGENTHGKHKQTYIFILRTMDGMVGNRSFARSTRYDIDDIQSIYRKLVPIDYNQLS